MKKLLSFLLTIISFASYSQSGSISHSGIKLRVQDSATYISAVSAAHTAGYADIFWNEQATTPHWDIWNGSSYDHVFDFNAGGGAGTVTSVSGTTDRITSTGGATPIIDVSATFEALLGKVANRIDQNNASTTSAQLATTLSDESGTGTVVYSSYVDAKVADAINNGTTTIAPSQNAVFDALCIITTTQVTSSTAGGTITLNFQDGGCDKQSVSFVGSATFAAARVIALSNTTNAKFFNFIFEVTNIAAVITVPGDWVMSTPDFDGADWTPPLVGQYQFGGSFDDVNNVWYVSVEGPYN